jgi:tetratricopeptide (TPR) repeat protein
MLSGPAVSQQKTAKAQAAKRSPSAQELVLQGKVAEAFRLAAKTPNGPQDTLKELLAMVDLKITDRQIAQAGATLEAAERFVDEWARVKKGKDLSRDALKGRKLRLQGIELNDKKEYAKAEGILKQALEMSKQLKDPVLEAGVRNNLGYALRFQQKLEESAKEFETARQIAESQKDNLRAASYNLNLGDVLLQLDRAASAIDAFKRAEVQGKAASKSNVEARAILMQGLAQIRIVPAVPEPLRQEPIRLMEKAEKMFEEQGDDRNTGWALYLIADRMAYSMKFADAAALGERAILYLSKAKDKEGLRRCYFLLMDMFNRLGDIAKSSKYKKLYDETEG